MSVRPAASLMSPEQQTDTIVQSLGFAFSIEESTVRSIFKDLSRVDLYHPPRYEQGFPKVIRITAALVKEWEFPLKQHVSDVDLTFVSMDLEALRELIARAGNIKLFATQFLGTFSLTADLTSKFDFNEHIQFPLQYAKQKFCFHLNPYWRPSGALGKMIAAAAMACFERNPQADSLDTIRLEYELKKVPNKDILKPDEEKIVWSFAIEKRQLWDPWNSLLISRFDDCGLGPVILTEEGLKPLNLNAKFPPPPTLKPAEGVSGGLKKLFNKAKVAVNVEAAPIAFSPDNVLRSLSAALGLDSDQLKSHISRLELCKCYAPRMVYGYSAEVEISAEAMRLCVLPAIESTQTTHLDFSQCILLPDALIELFTHLENVYAHSVTLTRPLTAKEECALGMQWPLIKRRCPAAKSYMEFVTFKVHPELCHSHFKEHVSLYVNSMKGPKCLLMRYTSSHSELIPAMEGEHDNQKEKHVLIEAGAVNRQTYPFKF